jgi:hypothetical protein
MTSFRSFEYKLLMPQLQNSRCSRGGCSDKGGIGSLSGASSVRNFESTDTGYIIAHKIPIIHLCALSTLGVFSDTHPDLQAEVTETVRCARVLPPSPIKKHQWLRGSRAEQIGSPSIAEIWVYTIF